MIGSADDEAGVGHSSQNRRKSFHQSFQAFVCAPVADRKKPLVGISAQGKIGRAGTGCERTVRSEEDILSGIFLAEGAAISGEQNGNGIGVQEHAGGQVASEAIDAFLLNSCVTEVDMFQNVMQSYVGEVPHGAHQCRSAQSSKGVDWMIGRGEGRVDEVEPDDVGLRFMHSSCDLKRGEDGIGIPAAETRNPQVQFVDRR